MSLRDPLRPAREVYHEYPRQFWVLVSATFVDRLGGALLYPFFALYITKKFDVGLTDVGVLFAVFSGTALVGGMVGGALTDRMGRKLMVVFGLILSALTTLMLGLVDTYGFFLLIVVVIGIFGEAGIPAQRAMVADLLPPEKRVQGYGILRVVLNLAVTIGPAIGGLLAAKSYMLLFVADAVTSLITAGIVIVVLRETKPQDAEGEVQETVGQSLAGYLTVLRDRFFLLFVGLGVLVVLVYVQMQATLGVYLRDFHGIQEAGYGLILSLNAGMVVLLQFPITRWVSKYRPMFVLAAGSLLYAVGFSMYGFVSAFSMFLVAMVVITIGEMFIAPVSETVAADLSPDKMRGRYMAVFGLSWGIPSGVGILLAGVVVDNFDPRIVWYAAGIIGVIAAVGYLALSARFESRTSTAEPN